MTFINVAEGVTRFSGNVELYNKYIKVFLSNKSFAEARNAYDKKDYDGMFFSMHSLKGVVGNLSLTLLYNVSTEVVEALRNKDYGNIDVLWYNFEQIYFSTLEKIREYLNETE